MFFAFNSLSLTKIEEDIFTLFPVLNNISLWREKTTESNKRKDIEFKFVFFLLGV